MIFSADCNVGGIDTNVSLSESIGITEGIMLLLLPDPILCNGTLTSFSASGFCPLNTTVIVRLRLYRRQEAGGYAPVALPISVRNFTTKCENRSSDICSVHAELMETDFVQVFSGDFIGIRFNSNDSESMSCNFEPAVVNITGSSFLTFPLEEMQRRPIINDIDEVDRVYNLSLQLSARIDGTYRFL